MRVKKYLNLLYDCSVKVTITSLESPFLSLSYCNTGCPKLLSSCIWCKVLVQVTQIPLSLRLRLFIDCRQSVFHSKVIRGYEARHLGLKENGMRHEKIAQ